ncbi:Protein kinase-like domain containing protein [Elaphomyces granulatus]
MANRMSAARQLLKALECLHKANIVHHNLNGNCVMWGVAPLDNLSTKTKYRYIGRPKKRALPDSWGQGELVGPLTFPKRLITDAVYLGGFRLATEAGTEVKDKVPLPLNIRYYAPERFHNINPSFASDMWSYMCLFLDLYLGCVPWSRNSHVPMITAMVRTLGPLPEKWKGCYNSWGASGSWWYDQRRRPDLTFESVIKQKRPEISEVERNHIVSIVSKVFCYSPDDRPTATQLLQDPSFQAVMEIYCR